MGNKEIYDLKKRVQAGLRCCHGTGECDEQCPYGGMEQCRNMLRWDANHVINALWTDNKRLRKRLAVAMTKTGRGLPQSPAVTAPSEREPYVVSLSHLYAP